MITYRFLLSAEEELIEASRFYESRSAGLGVEFLDDVHRVIDEVREFPELGVSIRGGLRRVLLRRFPFSLIYFNEPNTVLIVAVAHLKRRPDYWRDRS